MGVKERNFMKKNKIDISKIMYMTRNGRKTIIHLDTGAQRETFLTMKGLIEGYSDDIFKTINKGIVISAKYLDKVENNQYYMADGTVFTGRTRMTKQQLSDVLVCSERFQQNSWSPVTMLENMPIAFCVIELVFDENNHGIDFIFRYCNKAMEILEGIPLKEMLNRSFYEIFKNGDKKWLATYADVALNGVNRTIESYSKEVGSDLRVYCYQIMQNFCGCLLVKLDHKQVLI